MCTKRFAILSFLPVLFIANIASAATEVPVKARLYVGATSVNPTSLNDVIQTQGMAKMDSVTHYGVDITYPVLPFLDLGVRYTKHLGDKQEDPSNSATDYYTKIDQDSVALVARVPLLKTDILRADIFGGFGGSNTTVKLKNSAQDGELTKKADSGWFATPYSVAGASVGIGWKHFFVFFEGGIESNKVDGFSRTGTTSSNITNLDLSGGYFSLGIFMDGIPGTIGK